MDAKSDATLKKLILKTIKNNTNTSFNLGGAEEGKTKTKIPIENKMLPRAKVAELGPAFKLFINPDRSNKLNIEYGKLLYAFFFKDTTISMNRRKHLLGLMVVAWVKQSNVLGDEYSTIADYIDTEDKIYHAKQKEMKTKMATTKKEHKKAVSKVIKQYMKDNPEATIEDLTNLLKKEGLSAGARPRLNILKLEPAQMIDKVVGQGVSYDYPYLYNPNMSPRANEYFLKFVKAAFFSKSALALHRRDVFLPIVGKAWAKLSSEEKLKEINKAVKKAIKKELVKNGVTPSE